MSDQYIFNVDTPLGMSVRCTQNYWDNTILKKHTVLKDKLDEIIETLEDPDVIRQSKRDGRVYLFYRGEKTRWLCAVIKSENDYGFLVTAYPTDAIKEGEEIWKK